jgi:hypothetical protein
VPNTFRETKRFVSGFSLAVLLSVPIWAALFYWLLG